MLFWSNSRSAPSDESRSDARAFERRSLRSRAKSIRCSQSTAIVAPREAIFIDELLLAFVHEYRTPVRYARLAGERRGMAGRTTIPGWTEGIQPIAGAAVRLQHRAEATEQ